MTEQRASHPAPARGGWQLARETAQLQYAFAAELVEDVRHLEARATELLAQRRAERAAITGIGVAMLAMTRSAGAVAPLEPVVEPDQQIAA